jgi:hypothetical protein
MTYYQKLLCDTSLTCHDDMIYMSRHYNMNITNFIVALSVLQTINRLIEICLLVPNNQVAKPFFPKET